MVCTFPVHKKYDVIVMDPPWPYSHSKCKRYRGVISYNTMSLQELSELPIHMISKPDCALLMWCTGPQLPHSFSLFARWGFKYKTIFIVWRKIYESGKPRCGMGWYTRPCHEYLLLGVRGSVLKFRQCCNLSQAVETTLQGHSIKPQESFDVIESFFGMHTEKIELFARQPRLGWDTWGEELTPHYRRGCVGYLSSSMVK